MNKFDSFTLKLFAEETVDFFKGARIQKIQQPSSRELVFYIRNFGDMKKFYVNFHPEFHHLCFMSRENEKRRNINIPKAAPMFCMLLRKYVQNAKITDINVPEDERIFEIYFEHKNELDEKSKLCLAIELMGKYSNVILYNYDTNVIIGCAHNVSSEKSRERELCGLLPYVYPPKRKKKNILKVKKEDFLKKIDKTDVIQSIVSSYYYMTVPFATDIKNSLKDYSEENLYDASVAFFSKNVYIPYIAADYTDYSFIEKENMKRCVSVNDMIDDYFSYHLSEFIRKTLKNKIYNQINSKLKKLQILKKVQTEIKLKSTEAEEYKNKADILIANLYKFKSGDKNPLLYDYEGNPVIIEFDNDKTPQEVANKYYSAYKKSKTAAQYAQKIIEETDSEILYYKELMFFTESSVDFSELSEIYSEISGEIFERKEEEKKSLVEFIEYKGFKIYFGKNKKQNDYLLSKIASSEDIWFHPLNAPGSHVILKFPADKSEITDDVILKAAIITKEYSSQKNNSKTSIIYTKRKYVNKAKNKQAFVTYRNESEIVV